MNKNAVILVAEDDAGHFELVKRNLWLSCVENEILHFKDGQEVLDFLFGTGEGPKYDGDRSYILLLDIRMPKKNGLSIIAQLRQHLPNLIIIVLTLWDTPEYRQAALVDSGADAYIIKENMISDLLPTLYTLLPGFNSTPVLPN